MAAQELSWCAVKILVLRVCADTAEQFPPAVASPQPKHLSTIRFGLVCVKLLTSQNNASQNNVNIIQSYQKPIQCQCQCLTFWTSLTYELKCEMTTLKKTCRL